MQNPAQQVTVTAPKDWNLFESTLAKEVAVSGLGLHTGRKASVRILPRSGGKGERGILFTRPGRANSAIAVSPGKRRWENHPLCSTMKAPDGSLFRTVEHLLAALLFCQIDHAIIELEGEEIPILDGSAAEWAGALRAGGRRSLPFPKAFLRITAPCEYCFGVRSRYFVEPAPACRITVSNKDIGFERQTWEGDMTPARFAGEIAPARSYGGLFAGLAAMALGYLGGMPVLRGARLSSVAATFNKRVIGGPRFPDEFIRHRVLDICGDFSIIGAPVLGHFHIVQPSHRRNHKFMRHVFRQRRDAWEWVSFSPQGEKDYCRVKGR